MIKSYSFVHRIVHAVVNLEHHVLTDQKPRFGHKLYAFFNFPFTCFNVFC